MDPARVSAANSVLEVVQMADDAQRGALATTIAAAARQTALAHLRGAPTAVEVVIISRDGALLGRAGDLGPETAA